MPSDDPACFRLGCIPVRPIHWLWRPCLACGKPAFGVVGQRERKDGRAFWQWSNSTLPHGTGRHR